MWNNKHPIIDAHCHIYPEKIAEKAAQATGRFYGEAPRCKGTVADLLNRGAQRGIDHFVVQSVATSPKQVMSINRFIARQVADSDGKLTGLGTLHPESTDLAADLENLRALGLKGVKLHPDIQRFQIDQPCCLVIYELCARDGIPILMHCGDKRYDYSNPNRLLPILKRYPHLTVIGAHFGGWSVWEDAAETLHDLPNLYVDCSSSLSFMSPETARNIIRRYGAHRVLFGTDYPLHAPDDELRRFEALKLTEAENRLILYENVQKIIPCAI